MRPLLTKVKCLADFHSLIEFYEKIGIESLNLKPYEELPDALQRDIRKEYGFGPKVPQQIDLMAIQAFLEYPDLDFSKENNLKRFSLYFAKRPFGSISELVAIAYYELVVGDPLIFYFVGNEWSILIDESSL